MFGNQNAFCINELNSNVVMPLKEETKGSKARIPEKNQEVLVSNEEPHKKKGKKIVKEKKKILGMGGGRMTHWDVSTRETRWAG